MKKGTPQYNQVEEESSYSSGESTGKNLEEKDLCL